MASQKRLKSIAHSIAHHAVSGLSFVHPHLGKECEKIGISEATIDLTLNNPCPKELLGNKALVTAIFSLKETYLKIIKSEGFNQVDISSIKLRFLFENSKDKYWCSVCESTIVSKSGKTYSYAIDWAGKTVTNKQYISTY